MYILKIIQNLIKILLPYFSKIKILNMMKAKYIYYVIYYTIFLIKDKNALLMLYFMIKYILSK